MSRRGMPAIDNSKYQQAFQRLAREAIGCAPVVWKQGRLTITIDGKSLYYDLESDSSRIPALTTPELGDLCVELYQMTERDGQQWSQCEIGFWKSPDDSWDFEAKFGYQEP